MLVADLVDVEDGHLVRSVKTLHGHYLVFTVHWQLCGRWAAQRWGTLAYVATWRRWL